jgi:hypothetical protein
MEKSPSHPPLAWHSELAFLARVWAYALARRVLPGMLLLLVLLSWVLRSILSSAGT